MTCTPEALAVAKLYRARRADEGTCINGISHGPRTHGVRCYLCMLCHRYGPRRRPALWQRVDGLTREIRAIGRVDLLRNQPRRTS